MKKLYRNTKKGILFGILAGIGDYVNLDPTVIRIIFLVLLLATGVFPFVLLYILGYYLISVKPPYNVVDEQ
ncbi:MAG: PspC domain-containing protein [Candidatus Magasanikbacteria bacterium CG_4_9_14_0_2_um_filter_42_11]|uniref:PspC domain-containing protein n=1 Tax=Candidatus Magasanikbacteria bacterium CG_4_9_14_0_2_um_filter_42_11 TaxID=1974643 RepID=A0A2M8F9L3_9BACT|nr:MAG: PspC domain-containing protein [Candidatus Magasanikbacteria bacterium CG10_big_fil_rev_8_21_14_0_10_43_9]PJC52425.1 MAG: PspC domain-containing protein [Candidatus Magasanikbacteria bacterium CG_4_9_14_0_2_um_filter_42_11]